MPIAKDIPFRSIPRQSALFLSYLDFSKDALRFFQHAPTIENVERFSRNELAQMQFPRREIVKILRRQNESFGGDSTTLHNIESLEEPDCVAILTGQQVGLFASPLYTIFKAFTAIKMAADLRRHGIKAVPIFWMETEDHDLAEVTHLTLLDTDSMAHAVDYRKTLFGESDRPAQSVGSIQFSDSIRQVVNDYITALPNGAWKSEIHSILESAYKPGATMSQSFARLLSWIFQGYGLILFDPHDTEAKRLASDVYTKAVREAGGIHSALVQRNHELEAAGFHAQVSTLDNSTVLFIFENGERRALERRNTTFTVKNGGRSISQDALLKDSETTPEKFSPNVLLRPLIQDHLFPTAAYVGGPAEIAYFAQIEAIYSYLGRPMPVIWPRNSYTLIEPDILLEIDRRHIDIQDCFHGRQHLIEKALRNSNFDRDAASLQEFRENLAQTFAEIQPGIQAAAPPLIDALTNSKKKILHNIQRLKSLIVRLEAKKNSSVIAAAGRLLNHCYPNNNLQERELSIHTFLARHGFELLRAIHSATDIGNFAHRVLPLDDVRRV